MRNTAKMKNNKFVSETTALVHYTMISVDVNIFSILFYNTQSARTKSFNSRVETVETKKLVYADGSHVLLS